MVVGVGSRHIFGSFVEIIEQNGWQGLWAGNTINMLRIIPTQAVEMGTFEFVKRSMAEAQEKWKEDGYPKIQLGNLKLELPLHFLSPVAIAGAAAGIAGTLACHPLEVIKVIAGIVDTQRSFFVHIFNCQSHVTSLLMSHYWCSDRIA